MSELLLPSGCGYHRGPPVILTPATAYTIWVRVWKNATWSTFSAMGTASISDSGGYSCRFPNNHAVVPPRPEIVDRDLTSEILAALRGNVLRLLPRAAYEEDVVVLRLFGRRLFLFNDPQAIHRVLVENLDNFGGRP